LKVLLVDDDAGQLEIRRLILEARGYEVAAAAAPEEALELAAGCARVVMDLRMPRAEDGRALIRALRAAHPELPIVVLSGFPHDIESAPERNEVRQVLEKPVRIESLFKALAALALCLLAPAPARAEEYSFTLGRRAEVLATLTLSAPGGDWAVAGREGSVAVIECPGLETQHVVVATGDRRQEFSVFLGPLEAGRHTLRVRRDPALSAKGAGLAAHGARFRALDPAHAGDLAVLHAPVLYARENTVGRFNDVPLLAYFTGSRDGGARVFEYTIVFSNEDGGTTARNLMARWGRTTDIEYVYRVWLDAEGRPAKTLIQTKDHKDVPYEGEREGFHPLLIPVTQNNMVAPAGGRRSALRFQLAPEAADFTGGARELAMDRAPFTYEVSAKELRREGKLRPHMAVLRGPEEEETISDPRNYLVIEAKLKLEESVVQFLAPGGADSAWVTSSMGQPENYIGRDGWVRAAIELPPAALAGGVKAIGFECALFRDEKKGVRPKIGRCVVEKLGKVFLLGPGYTPLPPLAVPAGGWEMRNGEILTLALPASR
jgi:CheY-like chemotaxis protein